MKETDSLRQKEKARNKISEYKRIWITTDWEPNLISDKNAQPGRMNRLAQYLTENGYEVVLWFTTFVHPEKRYLCGKTKIIQMNENERIVLLHSSVPYKKNTSPMRFLYHSMLASEMKKMIEDGGQEFPKPDIIFCSYPTEQFCRVALKYGERHQVPVIMDARDQWPDIFVRAFPNKMQALAKMTLNPMKDKTADDFSRAAAICAMSPVMLRWALRYAGREKSALDRYIFIGCEKTVLSEDEMIRQSQAWRDKGISEETWNVCLFSTLSKSALNLDTVIKAVCRVHDVYPQIRLVIGGRGDDEERLKAMTDALTYIFMAGWLDRNQMTSLMAISKVGLLCYRNTPDFRDGWGNKVGQYLSYSLPLITSSEGFAKRYIEKHSCGIAYKENDADELSKNLIRLIEEPAWQKGLSDNAGKCYEADFEEKKVLKKFEDMITDVCIAYYEESVFYEHIADQPLRRIDKDGHGVSPVLFGSKLGKGGGKA